MLGDKQAAGGIERKALAVAQPGGVALRRRETLIFFVRLIEPDAGAGFKLGAWLMAGRIGDAVLQLAGIGRRTEIDEHVAIGIDDERMHRVIAGERQAGHYDLRLFARHDAVRRQGVADDLVVLLGIEAVFVDADTGAAGRSLRHAVAETLDPIGVAVALGVFERHQEAAGRRLVVMIIAAAPGVDVERAVGTEHHLAGVAEIVGENGCAEAGRQGDAASVGGAGIGPRAALILLCNGGRSAGEQRSDDKTRCTKRVPTARPRRWMS